MTKKARGEPAIEGHTLKKQKPRHKKFMTDQHKKDLFYEMDTRGKTIREAAKSVGMHFSTAKYISMRRTQK